MYDIMDFSNCFIDHKFKVTHPLHLQYCFLPRFAVYDSTNAHT